MTNYQWHFPNDCIITNNIRSRDGLIQCNFELFNFILTLPSYKLVIERQPRTILTTIINLAAKPLIR